jgi:signal transduction histidine kinase
MKGWTSRARRMVAGWIVTLVGLALAAAGLLPFRSQTTGATSALVLLVPVTLGVAVGGLPAVPVGVVAGILTFHFLFIPPYYSSAVGPRQYWITLFVYAAVGCTVGVLVARFQRARQEAETRRVEVALLLEEQAALRRVATLVAHGVPPDAVFDAVTAEVSHLLGADAAVLVAYEPDGTARAMAGFGEPGIDLRLGGPLDPDGHNVTGTMLRSGQTARMDDYAEATGGLAPHVVSLGLQSGVGSPIVVEGRIWGAVIAFTKTAFAPAIEQRMAQFTELAGTAIANADSRAELAASRARVVAAADEARRRIERDLHDGLQQHLVSLALELRLAASTVSPAEEAVAAQVAATAEGLEAAVEELQELGRGIHPAILAKGGLIPALQTLAGRSAVPVQLDAELDRRLPDRVEVAVYYVVAEALTNAAKHAHATAVRVDARADTDTVHLTIADDGVGGADLRGGSGLVGLKDRIEALGGRMELTSPAGGGTRLSADVPLGIEPSPAGTGGGVSGP